VAQPGGLPVVAGGGSSGAAAVPLRSVPTQPYESSLGCRAVGALPTARPHARRPRLPYRRETLSSRTSPGPSRE
jgi:hypothetical protein